MSTQWDVESVATELLACEDERRDRVKFTDEWPELDVATGYEIQDLTLQRRLNVLAEKEHFADDATIALVGS